ncbi:hypothetical protein TBLA_0A07640 [Henningerozyma blattae CBS 6284]|uniref:Protein transport protein Sec61 subunit beta n=1 Tax=Henningerozyma blattae (strain ATCC 34711 / CBS 6284 / DSM 70876 / NBRC 10599 / NRRL Y-10934 / UCD 77-7) TaxID=1071380 RepID=I2GWQ1_HENB6|nr:hypothetical protein TBLA_0A07640 [Tetrapisispora blattae CBS 6284]CCH58553.1 hypothetical protein TBLA_0A07640 [Tetrapisispora blattae CBS 6284]
MSSTNNVPGGQRTLQKRRQAQAVKQRKDEKSVQKASQISDEKKGSILKIYNDEANGLRVDPLVILFLAVGFIFSVIALHVISKMTSSAFGGVSSSNE